MYPYQRLNILGSYALLSLYPMKKRVVFPLGPRIRWSGIVAGVIAAFAVILLGTMLGIAIGLFAPSTLLLLNTETLQDFGTTAVILGLQ